MEKSFKNNKLETLRGFLRLTNRDFAEKIGVHETQYTKMKKGTYPIGDKTINKIKSNLPEYNINWLLYGVGEMKATEDQYKDNVLDAAIHKMFEKDKEPPVAANFIPNKTKPRLEAKPLSLMFNADDFELPGTRFQELPDGTLNMLVSVVPARGYAGYLRGFPDPEYYEGLETISISVLKQHKGHYLAFEVSGDSMTTMEPGNFKESIFDGSIVVGRELSQHHWKYKLHTHNFDAWVIVHRTEGILIKQIIDQDIERGYITIHSLNPDKDAYPDQELFLDDIEQIFNIVQIVNKR